MEHYNDFLYHHGVKGMKWGVRKQKESSGGVKLSRRERKTLKKEAKKLNRKQYRLAKEKANDKYLKKTEKYHKAESDVYDSYYKEKDRIRKEAEGRQSVIDFASKNKNSDGYRIASSFNETTRQLKSSRNERIKEKALDDLWTVHGSTVTKANAERKKSIAKAKNIYKSNKKAIASGNYDVVKKGKKALGK